ESPPVEQHLRECQGSGEAYANAGPCREDHCLRGSQPPLAQDAFITLSSVGSDGGTRMRDLKLAWELSDISQSGKFQSELWSKFCF
ncbi:hypothetical protein CHARACLAT_029034, partial [Characodon lateralis]|nr:hypothetical protein [Characodon lateralis]